MTPTDAPPDRRERNRRRVREALRTSALELFSEKGFAETTVTDITERADVSRRTFFRYFESKEDVIGNDLRDLLPRVLRELESRPRDEHPLASIHASVLSVVPEKGPPALVFRIGRRAELLPFGRRLLPVLMQWEQGIAATLLVRWGATPAAASEELRLRATVTACAATSALRCAALYTRMTPTGQFTVDPDIVSVVTRALDIIAEGCPPPG